MDLRYTVRHFFFLNYFEDACVVSKYDLVFGCLWWGSINLSIACFGPLNSWDFCLLIQSTPGCVSDRTKTNPFNPICKPSKSMNKNATFLLLATGVPLSKIQDFIPSTALLYPLLAQPQISPRSEKTSAPQVAWDWDSSQRRLVTRPWPFPPPHGSPVGREVPSPESARRWALVRGWKAMPATAASVVWMVASKMGEKET